MTDAPLPTPNGAEAVAAARQERTKAIEEALREIVIGRARLMQALAERVGVAPSDFECLELAYLQGGITSKELAIMKAVSVGAISQSLKRLEDKGLIRREADPTDGRRSIVRARSSAVRKISPIFERLSDAVTRAWLVHSDEELAIARKILSRAASVMRDEVEILEASAKARFRASR